MRIAASSILVQHCLLPLTTNTRISTARNIQSTARNCRFKPGPTHYYDVLEITPKANHSQIKSAFYRLSKVYHPDINSDKVSVEKFREISEAYEILGNQISRKRYDKGVLNPLNRQRPEHHSHNPNDHHDKSFGHRHYKRRGPIMTGKTQHFDFDEFYRQHYGEQVLNSFKQKYGHGRASTADRFRHENIDFSEVSHENPRAHLLYILVVATLVWFIGGLYLVDHAWIRKLEKPVDDHDKK